MDFMNIVSTFCNKISTWKKHQINATKYKKRQTPVPHDKLLSFTNALVSIPSLQATLYSLNIDYYSKLYALP